MRRAVIEAAAPNPDGRPKDCYGKTHGALVELVQAGYPAAKLVQVLRHRPPELGVPKLVAWLVDQARIGFPALPSTADLEEQLREVELRIRTMAAEGMDHLVEKYEADARSLREAVAGACETGPMEVPA